MAPPAPRVTALMPPFYTSDPDNYPRWEECVARNTAQGEDPHHTALALHLYLVVCGERFGRPPRLSQVNLPQHGDQNRSGEPLATARLEDYSKT